jgi:altronate dehydratase large subunit
MAGDIASTGKPVEVLTVSDCGGAGAAAERGIELARRMVTDASRLRREQCSIGDLSVAVKCGVSDITSGIAGNPTVGSAFDAVVEAGGTAFFSENTEIIGAEQILAERAATPDAAQAILDTAARTEEKARSTGQDIREMNPIPANIAAGISTLAEKSIGAIAKGGTSPLRGVLRYAERPPSPGLYFVDAWMSSYSLPAGYAAAGAQMCLYVMGGESLPAGVAMPTVSSGVVIPMLYLTGNPRTYEKMEADLDFNAGAVLEGTETPGAAGECLLALLADVASGALTKTEALRHTDPVDLYFEGPVF